MKTKLFLSTILVSSLMVFNLDFTANAHLDGDSGSGDGDEQEHDGDNEDHHGDCDIDGSEIFKAKVMLVATTNAPAGARGCAKLEAENEDGVVTAELKVKTKGLNPGDYTLSVVRISDGSTVVLGQITIVSPVDCDHHDEDEDENEDENDDDDSGDNEMTHVSWSGDHGEESEVLVSETEVTLPADLDPMDIGQIIVSDVDGNPLLVGDVLNPVPGTTVMLKAHIHMAADVGAPDATGTAHVFSSARKGKRTNRFTLVVSGVPARSAFRVHLNGNETPASSVKSNKKGKVLVQKLRGNLLKLRSIQLKDSNGNAVARGNF